MFTRCFGPTGSSENISNPDTARTSLIPLIKRSSTEPPMSSLFVEDAESILTLKQVNARLRSLLSDHSRMNRPNYTLAGCFLNLTSFPLVGREGIRAANCAADRQI